jgi:hypothetical protein
MRKHCRSIDATYPNAAFMPQAQIYDFARLLSICCRDVPESLRHVGAT